MDNHKENTLRRCFEDTIWMAIRYAHGRHTYAPGMVRDAVESYREIYPDWKPREDITLSDAYYDSEMSLPTDYLFDLFEENETTD